MLPFLGEMSGPLLCSVRSSVIQYFTVIGYSAVFGNQEVFSDSVLLFQNCFNYLEVSLLVLFLCVLFFLLEEHAAIEPGVSTHCTTNCDALRQSFGRETGSLSLKLRLTW